MSFRSFRMLTFLIGVFICNPAIAAELGPGEAAARSDPPLSGSAPGYAHADFKVLVWYRRADPLATFKYQVYDLRKGEFTPAVVAWIKTVNAKYPTYTAFTRDVDLSAENGKTDALKVGCGHQDANSRWLRPCQGSYSAVRSTAVAGHSNRWRVPAQASTGKPAPCRTTAVS